jgi:hypothetical protein
LPSSLDVTAAAAVDVAVAAAAAAAVPCSCSVFNQDAEACGPFCDDMTITLQGGIYIRRIIIIILYITIAYSHEEGNTLEAPPGDNCESLLAGNFLNNLFEEGLTTERIANASLTAQPTSALLRTWTAILLNVYGSDLFARARREIGPFGGTPSRKASLRGIGSKGYAGHARGLYGGMGFIHSFMLHLWQKLIQATPTHSRRRQLPKLTN